MDKLPLKELIEKFKSNNISDAELSRLKEYLASPNANDVLDELAREESERTDIPAQSTEERKNQLFSEIWEEVGSKPAMIPFKHRPLWVKLLSACAASLLLAFGAYWLYHQNDPLDTNLQLANNREMPILPGGSKAKLLLDDGRTIDLESLSTDTLIDLEGYSIRKNEQGELTYVVESDNQNQVDLFNTIITPKGGEYTLNLPDGTQIWVNASSRLRYPLNFSEAKREVELSGEAYFEVAKLSRGGKRVPFFVYTGDQRLEVLGTSFNINSYGKTIETTLVEGKVKLSFPKQADQILAPNQQAVYAGGSKTTSVRQVDPFYVISWKNGSFAFEDTPIVEVMENLARWYDLDVSYDADVRDLKFTGTISKYEQIHKILQVIELTEAVTFKIEGRRVMVM